MKPSVRTIAFATVYWLIVFTVGFVLGVLRTLYLVPRIGDFRAELIEAPILLGACWWTAQWLNRRKLFALSLSQSIWAGTLAGLFLISAEISMTGLVRGVDFASWLTARSYGSIILFFLLAAVFAAMPTMTRSARS